MMECKKIGLVGSSGGHLTHLYMLKPFWQKKDRFWVTFDKEDARSLLEGERVYPCYYPTNRNLKNLLKNTVVAWKVYPIVDCFIVQWEEQKQVYKKAVNLGSIF